MKFIERLCACHSASIIHLLLDVIKSWQRKVMTQEAQTNREGPWKSKQTTPGCFKFKRNITKIRSNIWKLVSPPPQLNSDCAPLLFRDGFSKVQRPSKTDSLELLFSDSSRIISPLRKLLNTEQKHPLRNFQNGNKNISLRLFFLYSWAGNLMCTFSLELSSLGSGVGTACWVADHVEGLRAAKVTRSPLKAMQANLIDSAL